VDLPGLEDLVERDLGGGGRLLEQEPRHDLDLVDRHHALATPAGHAAGEAGVDDGHEIGRAPLEEPRGEEVGTGGAAP
jgi:hypothetical protein